MADAAPAGWAARVQSAWLGRGALAMALRPLSWLYGALAALNRARFRLGLARVERLPVAVIVVGNLVAGGAGKTPTVIALVRRLRALGHRPGIVSRGHGRSGDGLVEVTARTPALQCGDEPLLLHLRTGVPVVVGRDRAAAGRKLLQRHPAVNVIVSDDGLQHHRLARDLQVLVFDERGIGNGWLLPAGPLREPVPAAVPPRSVVLYNAGAASTPWPGHVVQRRLTGVVALEDWWAGAPPSPDLLAALRGRPLLAVAGLARPGRFFDMLRAAGLTIDTLALPDHDAYSALPWSAGIADVIVTEKDAVKLVAPRVAPTRVWVAALDFSFDAATTAALDAALTTLPAPAATGATRPP